MKKIASFGILSLTASLLVGCASAPKTTANISPRFDPPAQYPRNPGAVRVKISTSAQRIYVTEGDRVLLASPCAVGTPSTPTPAGTHRITSKNFDRRRVSQPGARYPMTYWMSFYSPSYGMHWGWVKPYPCTHGCVRLPIKTAQKVFNMVSVGTPVTVASSHPEDATVGRSLPTLDDSSLSDPPLNYMHSSQVFEDAKKGRIYNY
jgi:hypothetical protein